MGSLAEVDATPIGQNARSTPTTFSSQFEAIRAAFADPIDVPYLLDITEPLPGLPRSRSANELDVRIDDLTIADALDPFAPLVPQRRAALRALRFLPATFAVTAVASCPATGRPTTCQPSTQSFPVPGELPHGQAHGPHVVAIGLQHD